MSRRRWNFLLVRGDFFVVSSVDLLVAIPRKREDEQSTAKTEKKAPILAARISAEF